MRGPDLGQRGARHPSRPGTDRTWGVAVIFTDRNLRTAALGIAPSLVALGTVHAGVSGAGARRCPR